MKKTILEIYALAVCFITVTCFVVCLGIAGYSLIEIGKPDFTLSTSAYEEYQTNDAFWKQNDPTRFSEKTEKAPRPSEDELTKRRKEAYVRALDSEQREGYQTLIKTLIVMLVDAFAFLAHWIIANRARLSTVG
jgi:hypothetical protein